MLATLRSHIKRITIMEIVSPSSSESSHLGPGRIKILWRWQSGMPPPSPCRPPCFDLFSQTKMSNYFLKLWFVFSNKNVQQIFEALICFLKQRCPTIFWSFDLFSFWQIIYTNFSKKRIIVWNALTSPCFFYFFSQNYSELNFCHVTHSKIFNATYIVKFSCYKFLIVTVKWKYAEAFRTARNVD